MVNCLCCGKIFDCRNLTGDILRFLEGGGRCTFCGAKVSLSYRCGIDFRWKIHELLFWVGHVGLLSRQAAAAPPRYAVSVSSRFYDTNATSRYLNAHFHYKLLCSERSEERRPAAAAADADGSGAAAASGSGGLSAADAAAAEFKDRLVEYDRNSAKRTTVIDDQSDYFEIDTNAWLTGTLAFRI